MYLVFISLNSGSHSNHICDDAVEVISLFESLAKQGVVKFETTVDVVASIENDNWYEDNGSWCTVTKVNQHEAGAAALKALPKYFRDACIELQHYVRESEIHAFLESDPENPTSYEHPFIYALQVELGISGEVDITRDIATQLAKFQRNGFELPFTLYRATTEEPIDFDDPDEEREHQTLYTDTSFEDFEDDGLFPAEWVDFKIW